MILRENSCFEIINWILSYWGFGNNFPTNTNDFFLKNYVLEKEKILMFLWKGNKMKGGNNDVLLSEAGIPPKIT